MNAAMLQHHEQTCLRLTMSPVAWLIPTQPIFSMFRSRIVSKYARDHDSVLCQTARRSVDVHACGSSLVTTACILEDVTLVHNGHMLLQQDAAWDELDALSRYVSPVYLYFFLFSFSSFLLFLSLCLLLSNDVPNHRNRIPHVFQFWPLLRLLIVFFVCSHLLGH